MEALQYRNLAISCGTGRAEGPAAHASIQFTCQRALAKDQVIRLPIAITEFSLADLVGLPRLLASIDYGDGRQEFRYGLSGSLCAHQHVTQTARPDLQVAR